MLGTGVFIFLRGGSCCYVSENIEKTTGAEGVGLGFAVGKTRCFASSTGVRIPSSPGTDFDVRARGFW